MSNRKQSNHILFVCLGWEYSIFKHIYLNNDEPGVLNHHAESVVVLNLKIKNQH